MPINGYSKDVFNDAPVKTKFGILFDMNENILKQLEQHPTNCNERFFAMEKDLRSISKRKTIDSIIAVLSAIGVSAGLAIAYIKGWIIFIKD